MRILQIIPTLWVGGAERVVGLLARHLKASGHDVGVVSMFAGRGTFIEEELRAARIPLYFLGKRRGPDLRMIPRIARVLAGFRPDVLHTHLYVLKYALPALVGWRRSRVVHTVHNLAEHEVERSSRILQYLAFRAGVVPVAIGEAVAESMKRVYRLSAPHRIPNGIPVSEYAPAPGARDEIRQSLAIPPGAPTFLAVGRLEPQKNTAALFPAFASPRLRALGAHLLLAGDGELRPELEQLARRLELDGRVHFLGVRRDVPRLLAAADAFVLASRYEGNPLTVMEAMAAGRPVVATTVGCVSELVGEEAGFLVPPGDEPALEAAIAALAADPDLARTKGTAASHRARARFDASRMASAYERLYAEVA